MFNRPDQAVPIDDLLQDLESATQRMVLASAWFTDQTIAQSIIDSRAGLKLAHHAREDAADEPGLPLATFPEQNPWPIAQQLDEDFWPEAEENA